MTMRHHTGIAASLVLVLGLLAGCDDETATGASATTTKNDVDATATSSQHEVVLSVPDMNCPMCPITVRKALAGVDGVLEAEASLDEKQARVVFDPARTNADALIAAVAETGFGATPRESRGE